MMAIRLRVEAVRELLLLVCFLVVFGAGLWLLQVDYPGLWFALGCVSAVVVSSYRLEGVGERELARMLRLSLAAFVDRCMSANILWLLCHEAALNPEKQLTLRKVTCDTCSASRLWPHRLLALPARTPIPGPNRPSVEINR